MGGSGRGIRTIQLDCVEASFAANSHFPSTTANLRSKDNYSGIIDDSFSKDAFARNAGRDCGKALNQQSGSVRSSGSGFTNTGGIARSKRGCRRLAASMAVPEKG